MQKIKCPHCGYVGYVDGYEIEQCNSCGEIFDTHSLSDDDYERRQDLDD